jgi:2-amino-4-hydroxy-6-hydroxymethyldihydropteridine diphosphokinase
MFEAHSGQAIETKSRLRPANLAEAAELFSIAHWRAREQPIVNARHTRLHSATGVTAESQSTRGEHPIAAADDPLGAIAYIALGSNLADRAATLESAITQLDALIGVRVLGRSSFHETRAVGGPQDQPDYLNAVVRVRTSIGPAALLASLLRIEADHGRVRGAPHGPRTLDLDLLLFGDIRSDDPALRLPHPRMWQRRFVLDPLAEVCDLPTLRRQYSPPPKDPQ